MGFIAAELKPVRLGELEDGKQHLSAGLRVDRSSEAEQNKMSMSMRRQEVET
jgi:hypothetical protein